MIKPAIAASACLLLAVTAGANAESTDAGKQEYEKVCSHCHDSGKMGAPLLSEPGDWADYQPIVAADAHQLHLDDGLLRDAADDPEKGVTSEEMEAATNYIVSIVGKGE